MVFQEPLERPRKPSPDCPVFLETARFFIPTRWSQFCRSIIPVTPSFRRRHETRAIATRCRALSPPLDLEGRSPGESLEAIQPGLAERGVITRTEPLYDRAHLTEQRTTSHNDTRPSLCFTRFLLLAIRNRLVDKLVECCALLGGADGSHDWIPYDVAVLIDNVGGREREQV